MKRLKKLIPVIIAMIIAFTAIVGKILETPSESESLLTLLEKKAFDFRFKHRPPLTPGNDVVLAVVDEKSLAKEGNWIWPRSKFADMIRILSDNGAKVIAFDVVFAEPDTRDDQSIALLNDIQQRYRQTANPEDDFSDYLAAYRLKDNNDRLLAGEIARSKTAVILGYYFEFGQNTFLTQEEISQFVENIDGSAYKNIQRPVELAPGQELIRFENTSYPQTNISVISQASPYSGFFNMSPDQDGTVRKMQAIIRHDSLLYPPLSLMALSRFLDVEAGIRFRKNEEGHSVVDRLFVGDRIIETDEHGRFYINYRGPGQTFPHISITDILNQNFAPGTFTNKIVVVGATAVGIYDVRVTPVDPLFPGAEVHANIIDMILADAYLHDPYWGAAFYLTMILFSTLLLALLLPRIGAFPGAFLAVVLIITYYYIAQHLFNNGYVVDLVTPLLAIVSAYMLITVYVYFAESRKKAFIKNAFSTYLAPTIVDQLIESPDKLVLGGERRKITSFFSDVQNFTSISENLKPEELVELLNEFLTEMTDIILAYQGTVDKFEGDAIIAFFGAPIELKNQAQCACRTSVNMQKRLLALRTKWKAEGKPELRMRIGLYTGDAVVGNMGSKSRMDYTMMGDTVNTAARLEGVNKMYGTNILIGETTKNEISQDEFLIREIDTIQVVGKQQPINMYELLGFQEDIAAELRKATEFYAVGLNAYRNGEWNQAISCFNQALELQPYDGPAKTILERCLEYQTTPPAGPWAGVFLMKSK